MSHWTQTLFKDQAGIYTSFFEERFDAADEEVEGLLELLEAEYGLEPETTLDVACGTGRHALAFAKRGCDSEGLDFSREFVDRADENARERGLDDATTFHHEDMRELDDWTGSYDVITVFWNSLGYYGRETDEEIMTELHRLSAEEGVLAIEIGNKDFFIANFEDASASERDGQFFVERRAYDVETGRFRTTLDLFDASEGYEHVDTLKWENRLYAAPVLRELCERAGFDEISLYGGFGGEELTLESDTVVLLAR